MPSRVRGTALRTTLLVAAALLAAACRRGPRPVAYGHDTCAYCRMEISDARYAAELVTHTGKVYTFDSIECLVSYYRGLSGAARDEVETLWVSDYTRPGTLISATTASYLRTPGPGSPMGRGMLAVANAGAAAPLRARGSPPVVMDWPGVLALAARERWEDQRPAHTPPMTAPPAHDPAGGSAARGRVSTATIADAIRAAAPGDTVVVAPGTYTGAELVIDKPIVLLGRGGATLDGEGRHQIVTVTADDVTIEGLRFAHVGTSYTEDRAAIKVIGARRCTIARDTIDDAFFAVYLAKASDCEVRDNIIRGLAKSETSSGNGIHLWGADDVVVAGNEISGQRDGIYLEFSRRVAVRGNLSEHNLRYGLHFMYSDDCRYEDNTFRENGAGVAVMYARRVAMTGNRFEHNWGSAAYGLLLKEIFDSRVAGNVFVRNTTGMLIDGANRLQAEHNDFVDNGWALKLDGSTQDGRFTANDFEGNTFDVGTTGRVLSTTINGNYWDRYTGYDLNRDGVGDVPYRPVGLFSVVVARNEPALILLRGAFVGLIDAGERAIPSLTPPAFADSAPRMRAIP